MAGVTGQRLRLTTTRKPKYRRGGLVIGTASAPTFVQPGEIEPEQGLAILRDPNITVAIEQEDGEIAVLPDEDRASLIADLENHQLEQLGAEQLPGLPDLAEFLASDGGVETDPAPEPEPTTEPTAQPSPAAPEPEAPPPAPKQRSKAKGNAA